jgi:hypothetical protein
MSCTFLISRQKITDVLGFYSFTGIILCLIKLEHLGIGSGKVIAQVIGELQ